MSNFNPIIHTGGKISSRDTDYNRDNTKNSANIITQSTIPIDSIKYESHTGSAFVYGSRISNANNDAVFINESTASERPQLRTASIAESRFVNTVRQPQQQKNNVAFAGFKAAKEEGPVCTLSRKDHLNDFYSEGEIHPEDPCVICRFGRWTHYNDLRGTKCGKWVSEKRLLLCFQQKNYPEDGCWTCDETLGPREECLACDACKPLRTIGINGEELPLRFGCQSICAQDQVCVNIDSEDRCVRLCTDDSDCDWQRCERCNESKQCVSSCSSGEQCVNGRCVGGCYPPCDHDKCQVCEYINGVYGCRDLTQGVSQRGNPLVCCNGLAIEKYDEECYRFQDCENRQVPVCPPGTVCYVNAEAPTGRSCRPIGCATDGDCNTSCCEKCTEIQCVEGGLCDSKELGVPDGTVVKMCLPCGKDYVGNTGDSEQGQFCVDGECITGVESEAQAIRNKLNCGRPCDNVRWVRDRPGCENTRTNPTKCGSRSECYECVDSCQELSQLYNLQLECGLDRDGKLGCIQIDYTQVASLNIIP